MTPQEKDSRRERLAALAHDQWSGWMRHLFRLSVSGDNGNRVMLNREVVRWTRQMATPYAELPESEKDSDRKEADRMLSVLGYHGNQPLSEASHSTQSAAQDSSSQTDPLSLSGVVVVDEQKTTKQG